MAIADELHAKLSPNEKSEIERPTTNDISAFDLYTRAKKLVLTPSFSVGEDRICCRRSICSTSQSCVIHRFSEDIANSPLLMKRFISLVTTIRRRVWPSGSCSSSGLSAPSGCRGNARRACVESLLGIPRLRRCSG